MSVSKQLKGLNIAASFGLIATSASQSTQATFIDSDRSETSVADLERTAR